MLFTSERLEIEVVERQRELYRSAAYTHWLQGTTKKTFTDYITFLGLIEKKNAKLTEKQKEKWRKKGESVADKIMRVQKKGKYSENVI